MRVQKMEQKSFIAWVRPGRKKISIKVGQESKLTFGHWFTPAFWYNDSNFEATNQKLGTVFPFGLKFDNIAGPEA